MVGPTTMVPSQQLGCKQQQRAAPGTADPQKLERMQRAVRTLLVGLGEDVGREGLRDTPKRVAKALLDMSQGYWQSPSSVVGSALFHEPSVAQGGEGVVIVRDIDFASTSEETLLPFHGRCHVAYVPKHGVVLGLSKLARLTRNFAKRLQTQARLGREVAAALHGSLDCAGVAVVLQARHMTMAPQAPQVTTACVTGCFAQPDAPQLEEFLSVLRLYDLPATAISTLHADAKQQQQQQQLHQLPLVHAPLGGLGASAGLSPSSSSSDMVPGPGTPDGSSSEKDTDGESDDMMAVDSPLALVHEGMEAAVKELLLEMGEDPARPGLHRAARQYVLSLLASTSGYHQHLPLPLQEEQADAQGQKLTSECRCSCSAPHASHASSHHLGHHVHQHTRHTTHQQQQQQQTGGVDGMVTVRVQFCSQCEHHMLPFYGSALIAYVPGPAGASVSEQDLEHVVAMFTQRLQVQERITHQVVDAVQQLSGAAGTMVVCDAAHMCMVARGVENHSGRTTTLAVRGVFEARPDLRRRVLQEFHAAGEGCCGTRQ